MVAFHFVFCYHFYFSFDILLYLLFAARILYFPCGKCMSLWAPFVKSASSATSSWVWSTLCGPSSSAISSWVWSTPVIPQTSFSLLGFLPADKDLPKAVPTSKLQIFQRFGSFAIKTNETLRKVTFSRGDSYRSQGIPIDPKVFL